MEDETRTRCADSDDMYRLPETEIREFVFDLGPAILESIYYLLCLALEALIVSDLIALEPRWSELLSELLSFEQGIASCYTAGYI